MVGFLNKAASLMLVVLMLDGLLSGLPLGTAAETGELPEEMPVSLPADEEPGAPEDTEPSGEAEDIEPSEEAEPPEEETLDGAPAEDGPEDTRMADEGASAPVDQFADAPVFAAEEAVDTLEALGEEAGDIYAMLGVDVTDEPFPAGSMRESAQPYGEKHIITFDELLVGGHNGSSETPITYLYGHGFRQNAALNKQMSVRTAMYRTGYFGGESEPFTFSLSSNESTAAFEGDFTGDGRKSQVAMLAYRNDHKLELWIGDAAPDASGGKIMNKLASFSPASGYPNSALLTLGGAQKDLHIKTGDLNGDHFDEIILLLPNYPGTDGTSADKSRLLVYALKKPTDDVTWMDESQWAVIYDQTFDIGFGDSYTEGLANQTETSRYHSLAVGDLNGDGKDDIALAGSEQQIKYQHPIYKSGDTARASLSVLISGNSTATSYVTQSSKTYGYDALFGSGALMSMPTPGEVDPNNTLTSLALLPAGLGVEIADSDDTTGNELLMGFNISATKKAAPTGKAVAQSLGYRVYQTRWNGSALERLPNARHFQVLTTDIHAATNGNAAGMGTLQGMFDTISNPHSLKGYSLGAVRMAAVQMEGPVAPTSIMVGNNRHEYTGSGYTLKPSYTNSAWQYAYYPKASGGNIYAVRPAVMNTVNSDGNSIPAYGYMIHYNYGGSDHVEFISGSNTANPAESSNNTVDRLHAGKLNQNGCGFACLPDTDMDTVILDYENYDFIYSSPTILAALAAPPYVGDIARTAGEDYDKASSTSFEMSLATGSGTTKTNSNSLGAYVAAEMEIGCPFASVVVETEVAYQHTWSTEFVKEITKKASWTYSADREDCVVVLVYPMDMYNYTMTYPLSADGEQAGKCAYTLYVPYTPKYTVLKMSEYAKLRAMCPSLPDIDKNVFTHEVGYPDTYSAPTGVLEDEMFRSEGATASTTGKMETYVTISSSTGRTTTSTNAVDFKLGAGAKAAAFGNEVQITAGVTYGHEGTKGMMVTDTSETTFMCELAGNDYHAANYYPFEWKMLQYNYRGGGIDFPVITYDVTMRRTADTTPYLPEDIWVDEARTTDGQITLCWTPSREDSGNRGANSNVIYGVFEKVSDSAYAQVTNPYTYNAVEDVYSITHTPLSAGLSHRYVIRTMRRSSTSKTWSPDSETIIGTTNPTAGVYGFTTQPEDIDIMPGATAQLKATFTCEGNYTVEYEWQRLSAQAWETVVDGPLYSGAATDTLVFQAPRAALAGTYRLGVTLRDNGTIVKQFISKEAEVEYKKERAKVTVADIGTLLVGETSVEVSATVAKVNAGATDTLDGTVRFTLTDPSGSSQVAEAVLGDAGVANYTFSLPQKGIYFLEATYTGNDVYGLAHAETISFSNDDRNLPFNTSFNPGTVTYTPAVQEITAQVYKAGSWMPVVPTVEIRRYNNLGVVVSTVVARGQPATGGEQVTHFRYPGVGKYQFAISYGDSTTVYRDVVVEPRNIEYTIDSVTRYLPEQVPASSDLSIRMTVGDPVADAQAGYSSSNLGVYNDNGEAVTLNANTPAGTYQIRQRWTPTSLNYNVTVHNGTYRVVKGAGVHSLTYGALPGTEARGSVRAVQPSGHTSGQPAANGASVLLVAEAAPGYEFSAWHEDGAGVASTQNGKHYYEIGSLEADCEVRAEFIRSIRVTGISIHEPAGPYTTGGTYTFTATATGVGISDQSVVWGLQGANAGGTWIDPATGQLTLAADESATALTLVATATEDPDFSKTHTIAVLPGGAFLNLQDGGANVADLVLYKGEVKPLALAGSGAIVDAEAASSAAAVTAALDTATNMLTITGTKVGTAVVTLKATVDGQSVTRWLSVRVVDHDGVTLSLSKTTLSLANGRTHKLGVTCVPSKTPFRELEWASADQSIATVDQTGKVTAVAPGRTTIMYRATPLGEDRPAILRTCSVIVTAPADSIQLQSSRGEALPTLTTLAMTGSFNTTQAVPRTIQLQAVVTPANTTDSVVWSSSNTAVATVDPAGNVTGGTKPGTATITAKAGKRAARYKVQVVATVPDGGITLASATAELKVKGSLALKPTVAKRTIEGKAYPVNTKLDWSTSDSQVAIVNASGRVTGKGVGSAIITATSRENPAITARYTVRVVAPVTSVRFAKSDFTMKTTAVGAPSSASFGLVFNNGAGVSDELAGMVLTLSDTRALVFEGDGASEDGKTYQLTDPNAHVRLRATDTLPGGQTKLTTTITAKTTHKSYKKPVSAPSLRVTVTSEDLVPASGPPVLVNAAKVPGCGSDDAESPTPALAVGQTFTPVVEVGPKDASDKSITWTIYAYWKPADNLGLDYVMDPADYVHFDRATGKVTAHSPTEVGSGNRLHTYIYVTGTATNGEKLFYTFRTMAFASKVTVRAANGAASAAVNTGESLQLAATVAPAGATANRMAKAVRWTSSNPAVATVDDTGLVTAGAKGGTVIITATANDDSKVAGRFRVTVRQSVVDAVITNAKYDSLATPAYGTVPLAQGATQKLVAKLNAANSTPSGRPVADNPQPANKKVRWEVVSETDARTGLPAPGKIVSLNTRTGVVKGLADGTALIRLIPDGCPDNVAFDDIPVWRKAGKTLVEERFSNTVQVRVTALAKTVKIDQAGFSVHGARDTSFTLSATTSPDLATLAPPEGNILTWRLPDVDGLDFDMAAPGMTGSRTEVITGGKATVVYTAPADSRTVTLKTAEVTKNTDFKLTVTAQGQKARTYSITIKVTAKEKDAPKLNSVAFEKSAVWVQVGATEKLTTVMNPQKPGNKNITWSLAAYTPKGVRLPDSEVAQVATIDAAGRVTAKGCGYVVVTARSVDGELQSSCKVYCVAKN